MKKALALALAAMLILSLTVSVSAGYKPEYTVNADPENIVIDGVINDCEWGDPIFTTTPDECLARKKDGWDYWSFVPAPADQKFELYVTNDGDNLYVAAKLINAEKDFTCEEPGMMWSHPHFCFTMCPLDKGIVCPVIEFEKELYEQYGCYTIGFVNGQPTQVCTTQGLPTVDLSRDMYDATYDEATRTYTYEVAVPVMYTNVNFMQSSNIAMGIVVGDAFNGGDGANRYLISKAGERGMAWMGANNFMHQKTHPLMIELNGADSLRTNIYEPISEKEIEFKHQLREYSYNASQMPTATLAAAIAAVFAAAAAVVCLIKAKNK